MRYALKAYAIQDIGHRDNQEDSLYPPMVAPRHHDRIPRKESFYESEPHVDDTLFMVCDGLGGHEHGEVASRIVCDVVSKHVRQAESEGKQLSDSLMRDITTHALNALNAAEDSSSERKMGTTMTLLSINDSGAAIAHIGDSRVYHFRAATEDEEAHTLFRTEDHNLASVMVRTGEMTITQAQNCRERHMLTRALMAGMDYQPTADLYKTDDIMPGDVFFLCSDGMVEEITDDDLCLLLTDPSCSDVERMKKLLEVTKYNSDNHTAWFVRVERSGNATYQPVSNPKRKNKSKKQGIVKRLINKCLSRI